MNGEYYSAETCSKPRSYTAVYEEGQARSIQFKKADIQKKDEIYLGLVLFMCGKDILLHRDIFYCVMIFTDAEINPFALA